MFVRHRELRDGRQREPPFLQAPDQLDARHVARPVERGTPTPLRRRKQAFRAIEPDGRRRQAHELGELVDCQLLCDAIHSASARIERRLLVNWRTDPEVVAPLLPAPFRPQLVDGSAVVGVCFVRLGHLRPRGLPAGLGLRSESAAHRIAVERDTADCVESSVYVLRRVTNSGLAVVAGGRLFPGVHSYGTFDVRETTDQLDIAFTTPDERHDASVSAQLTDALESRLFASMGDISTFFGRASVGWSPSRTTDALEGIELASEGWSMMPAVLQDARSAYFDDPERFPPGSTKLDSAVLMRELPVSWRALSHDDRNTDTADQRSRAELL